MTKEDLLRNEQVIFIIQAGFLLYWTKANIKMVMEWYNS